MLAGGGIAAGKGVVCSSGELKYTVILAIDVVVEGSTFEIGNWNGNMASTAVGKGDFPSHDEGDIFVLGVALVAGAGLILGTDGAAASAADGFCCRAAIGIALSAIV